MTCISLIAAVSLNDCIGENNQLPWHLPNDLKRFKQLTMGKPIVMGRKTHEAIGRVLPGRQNIVLSQSKSLANVTIVNSLASLAALTQTVDELMIIGGGEIYRLFYPYANKIYLTVVDTVIKGDTSFSFDRTQWQCEQVECHLIDANHPYNYEFIDLSRTAYCPWPGIRPK